MRHLHLSMKPRRPAVVASRSHHRCPTPTSAEGWRPRCPQPRLRLEAGGQVVHPRCRGGLAADRNRPGCLRVFGLCALRLGEPELGFVSLGDVAILQGRLGLPVARGAASVAALPARSLRPGRRGGSSPRAPADMRGLPWCVPMSRNYRRLSRTHHHLIRRAALRR